MQHSFQENASGRQKGFSSPLPSPPKTKGAADYSHYPMRSAQSIHVFLASQGRAQLLLLLLFYATDPFFLWGNHWRRAKTKNDYTNPAGAPWLSTAILSKAKGNVQAPHLSSPTEPLYYYKKEGRAVPAPFHPSIHPSSRRGGGRRLSLSPLTEWVTPKPPPQAGEGGGWARAAGCLLGGRGG